MAQRHFALARGLLTADPNAYLSSSIDLDESVVLWLTGDIASAIDLAERGAVVAFRIGWSKGASRLVPIWRVCTFAQED